MSSTSHGTVHFSTTLLLLLSCAAAQTMNNGKPNDPYDEYANFTPSMAIIIAVLIAALFFMGFFSIYIRHCSESRSAAGSVRPINLIGRSGRANNHRGLAPETIESFPIFAYSAVKDSKIGKGALECAVCLNEFEDDVTLRLLPKCDHVFHPPCIDAWLASHTTCPVCRADLEVAAGEVIVVAPIESINDDSVINDELIGDDDPVQQGAGTVELDRSRSLNQNRPSRSRSLKSIFISKFPRSHSTGHSVIQPGENVDRFTLRLPDEVRKEIMSRALNRTTSLLILPRESSTRFGYRNFRRLDSLDPVGKSDRWVFSMAPPFFARASSLRSSKRMENDGAGEGTSAMTPRGFITALKKSFGRLNSKGSEHGLASADSARPPV